MEIEGLACGTIEMSNGSSKDKRGSSKNEGRVMESLCPRPATFDRQRFSSERLSSL
jgi:hypothetical protein